MQGSEGFVRVLLLLVLIALAAVAFAGFEVLRRVTAPGGLDEPYVVWVQKNQTLGGVAADLEDAGAISNAKLFYYYGRLTGLADGLRAGEFSLPEGASMQDIAGILAEGDPVLRFVTIPEGVTVAQALAIIDEAPVLEGIALYEPAEGTMLPETYAYQRGEERDAVVQRTVDAHEALIDELWEKRAADLPFDTWEEAIILASIVEKETAVADERPRVAAVFVNRMKRRMRLQSDPTIIYGLTGGEPLGRGIRRSELDSTENPYNTYKINGLPPTPIANPGKESIAAVLNPADTDDLYFVADGTGGHVFASNLRDHNANVARWRRIERSRQNP